jgi:hypothetical protein
MQDPKYKGQQLVQVSFPADGNATIYINDINIIDKIRVTCFDSLIMTNYTPGVLIWSNIVNNYVGTCGTNLGVSVTPFEFSFPMAPQDGIEFWYPTKMTLNGEYTIRFTDFAGQLPTNVTGEVYILVEWFVY